MKRIFLRLKQPLRNERGEITFFACFFVVGIVMLISFLLLYASIRITCINIRNGAKMELNNLSGTIYADTYRSQRETNFEEYLNTLYSSSDYTGYSASISGEMSLMPDDIVPTASGKTMKSGYGVKTEVRATLSTDAPTSHITYPQTAFSVFPEFQYQTYLRLLQRSGGQSAKFIFKPNEFSTYDRTVHFTPLWFPDATDYTIYTQVWDTWTPDGMLSINLNDYVSIQGSLYDDWYTNRE